MTKIGKYVSWRPIPLLCAGHAIECYIFLQENNYAVSAGYWGTEMRYMAVAINTTLSQRVVGYPEGLAAAAAWDTFLETEVRDILQILPILWNMFIIKQALIMDD